MLKNIFVTMLTHRALVIRAASAFLLPGMEVLLDASNDLVILHTVTKMRDQTAFLNISDLMYHATTGNMCYVAKVIRDSQVSLPMLLKHVARIADGRTHPGFRSDMMLCFQECQERLIRDIRDYARLGNARLFSVLELLDHHSALGKPIAEYITYTLNWSSRYLECPDIASHNECIRELKGRKADVQEFITAQENGMTARFSKIIAYFTDSVTMVIFSDEFTSILQKWIYIQAHWHGAMLLVLQKTHIRSFDVYLQVHMSAMLLFFDEKTYFISQSPRVLMYFTHYFRLLERVHGIRMRPFKSTLDSVPCHEGHKPILSHALREQLADLELEPLPATGPIWLHINGNEMTKICRAHKTLNSRLGFLLVKAHITLTLVRIAVFAALPLRRELANYADSFLIKIRGIRSAFVRITAVSEDVLLEFKGKDRQIYSILTGNEQCSKGMMDSYLPHIRVFQKYCEHIRSVIPIVAQQLTNIVESFETVEKVLLDLLMNPDLPAENPYASAQDQDKALGMLVYVNLGYMISMLISSISDFRRQEFIIRSNLPTLISALTTQSHYS